MEKSSQEEKSHQGEEAIIEIHSTGSESTESLCTPCKCELSEAAELQEKMENEAPGDILDDLMIASKSLSQISVHDELDLETPYDLEDAMNPTEKKDSSDNSKELVTVDQMKEYSALLNARKNGGSRAEENSLDVEEKLSNGESDFFLRFSSLTGLPISAPGEPAVPDVPEALGDDGEREKKRMKFNESISLEKSKRIDEDFDYWEDELPPETELQKLDESVRGLTQENAEGSSKKKEEVTLKQSCVRYEKITKKFISRKKEFQELVTSVYEASSYLGRIKELLAGGPTSGPVVIPPPPKPSGYDQQFDFPDRSRFPKLSITRSSRDTNSGEKSCPRPQATFSSTSGQSKKSIPKLVTINNIAALKPSSIKSINRRIGISPPNRFKKQHPIREMLTSENKENKDTHGASGAMTTSFGKDTISDSESMYNYNPLVFARKTTK